MSRVITLSDEEYAVLERAAAARGDTPEGLVAEVVAALREAEGPVFYTTDAFLRHLGASDEEIHESDDAVDEIFPPDEGTQADDETGDRDPRRAANHADPR